MVKASDINKDIKSIAEKVRTAVFFYDDIHNDNVDNMFHYDYQKVIDEVSRLNGRDMTEELVENGILKPLAYGEYAVDVGDSTRGGGGINYRGTAFFSFSDKDYHIRFHELAHSLQSHYGLFDNGKLDKLYEGASKGLGDKADKKLVDRVTYSLYLNEMHSESFSYAAMMLRAKNPFDFAKQAMRAYNSGLMMNFIGLTDFRKKYDGGGEAGYKYYATEPIMKETIKRIWKIRKEGKTGEFFNENGVLNDEKLAKLSEDIVIKKGYSPRTLKSMFDYNVFDGHSANEHGWRRDMAKAVAGIAPVSIITLIEEGNKAIDIIKKNIMHKRLSLDENKKLDAFINAKTVNKTPEEQALLSYATLQALFTKIDRNNPGKYLDVKLKDDLRAGLANGSLPEAVISHKSKLMGKVIAGTYGKKKISSVLAFGKEQRKANEYRNVLEQINRIIKENAQNPYFKAVVESDMEYNKVWENVRKKEKEPDKPVIEIDKLEPKKEAYGLASYPIRIDLEVMSEFADKYDKSGELKKKLFEAAVCEPEKLSDKAFFKEIGKSFAPMGKKKGFNKELEEVLGRAATSYFSNKGNPLYAAYLEEIAKAPYTEMIARASGLEKTERAERELAGIEKRKERQASQTAEIDGTINRLREMREKEGWMFYENAYQIDETVDAYVVYRDVKRLDDFAENYGLDETFVVEAVTNPEGFLAKNVEDFFDMSAESENVQLYTMLRNDFKEVMEAFGATYAANKDKEEYKQTLHYLSNYAKDGEEDIVSRAKEHAESSAYVLGLVEEHYREREAKRQQDLETAEIDNKINRLREIKDTESTLNAAEAAQSATQSATGLSSEEGIVNDILKSRSLTPEKEEKLFELAIEVEKDRLNNNGNMGNFAEQLVNKAIKSNAFSEKELGVILNAAVKAEKEEIGNKGQETGKRLYFDEAKFSRFQKLKLTPETTEALNIVHKDGQFSVAVPHSDNAKKEVISAVRTASANEKAAKAALYQARLQR